MIASEIFHRVIREATATELRGRSAPNPVAYYGSRVVDFNGLSLIQTAASAGLDFDIRPAIALRRQNSIQGLQTLMQDFRMKYVGGTNNIGGMFDRYFLVNDLDTARGYMEYWRQLTDPAAGTEGYYSPTLPPVYAGFVSFENLGLLNRRNDASNTIWRRNSDGVQFRQVLLPQNSGPFTIFADQMAFHGAFSHPSAPETGSVIRTGVTGPSFEPGNGTPLCGWDYVLQDQNFGSNQGAGRIDAWIATIADGVLVPLSIFADTAVVSEPDRASIGYNEGGSDRIELSNNGGAYSPIATLADIPSVPAALTPAAAAGNQQDLTVSGLSGTNKRYEFWFRIITDAGAAATFDMRYNGGTTASRQSFIWADGTAGAGGADHPTALALGDNTATGFISGHGFVFQLNTGEWAWDWSGYQVHGADRFKVICSGNIGITTALTDLTIHASAAAGIRTGSSFQVQPSFP